MKFIEVHHDAIGTTTVPETAVEHLGEGWTVTGEVPETPVSTPYDPSDHTVADVLAYLEYATPEERDRVLAAEQDNKARTGIVGA